MAKKEVPNLAEHLHLSPTVVPSTQFSATADAELLRKAMKGIGTDEKVIIDILTDRSLAQRLEIAKAYENKFKNNLVKDIKSELSGNFRKLIKALLTDRSEFYAKELHHALDGLGTDEDVLIEVLCTLKTPEVQKILEAYKAKYKKSLEDDIKGDTGGYFKKLLLLLCKNRYLTPESVTDVDVAKADAKKLHSAGVKRFGTDESTFNSIFTSQNNAQLKLVFQEYENLAGHDIKTAIKKEFSGDIKDGLLAIVESVMNKPAFFAEQFHKAIKGIGTNDRSLIRLVVTRCEIDMGNIKNEYQKRYSVSLADAIKGDCSGDYRRCLLKLIE